MSSSHHTRITHLTYGPKLPAPAKNPRENISHSTRHTSPTDTKSSLLRNKPSYDRICSTLLLNPCVASLECIHVRHPRESVSSNTRQSKNPRKHQSSLVHKKPNARSLSLVCWTYPLLLPSTYHYLKIANKSTHGIVYHVKPASPQLPASWGVTLVTKCPAGFLSVVIILTTLKKA